jgi:hypothetical protein
LAAGLLLPYDPGAASAVCPPCDLFAARSPASLDSNRDDSGACFEWRGDLPALFLPSNVAVAETN